MSKLPNPNSNQPFETVYKNAQGQEEYGERTVDGLKEIVHIPSGKSNMVYHKPEKVLDPSGCKHEFYMSSIPKREITCEKCEYSTSFIVGINYEEEKDGNPVIILKGKRYKIKY